FVGDRFSGLQGLAFALPFAALATTAFGLPQVLAGEVLWWVIPAVAGIALLTPAFAFALEMLALKRMTHTAFGTLLAIEPAVGALMGLIVLAQQPTLMQLAGFVLVVIAGVFAQRGGKRVLDG
ncbi:MAG: EamA family transporter, partial [Microbacteriaceae bacterium]|nr:EamA family transporter [Microbacteriaceae bacterium]